MLLEDFIDVDKLTDKIVEHILQTLRIKLDNIFLEPNKNYNASDSDVLTFKELQLILKLSKPTIFNLMKKGELKYSKIGRRLFFQKKDVLKLIEEKKQK